jgi:peptidoglycan hydrolase-like protein with peptidoglycan-binding domain
VPGQTNNVGRGPLGVPTNNPISDPGTSARIQNRPNLPLGAAAPHHEGRKSTARVGGNRKLRTDRFPLLKLGARGNDVQRLQRLLNIHLDNDEQLKVDGIFGPKTRIAVLEFQKEEDLKPDAIVGRDTWFSLISAGTQEASWKAKPPAPPTKVVASSSTTTTKKTVDQWTLTERFEYVLQHCAPYLGPDMRAQFTALLTPVNLGIMVGSLVVWAAGHFFGVSEIADAFLLGFGLVFLGKAAIDAARLLKNVIEITCSASTEGELEDAAKDLAEAIAIIGVMTFFALLAKVARAIGNKLKESGPGEAETDTAETQPRQKKVEGLGETEDSSGEFKKPVQSSKKPPAPPETAQQAADRLLKKASEAEKSVTPDLKKLADANGAKMEGLDYRLKTKESLTRKIANDALENNTTLTEAAQNINDTLRYTMVLDKKSLATGANGVMKSLEDAGYTKIQVKNTFKPGAVYKGVNTTFESPQGQKFELQFHTPESFDMKQNVTHGLYEKARLPETSPAEKAALVKQMRSLSDSVPQPDNIDQIKNFP